MGPFVLILSYGSTKPIEIVQKIQAAKENSTNLETSSQSIEVLGTKFQTYDYNIKNKYFETVVKLLPIEGGTINTIPIEILQETEAILVTFDCTDKSFLTHIPKLCEITKKYNIQLGLFITTELNDNLNEGLSYGDIKEACKTSFDVIETLSQEIDEDIDDREERGLEKEENYSDIIEALENHIWSNVASSSGAKKDIGTNEIDEDFNEEQLEAYESLLSNIVNFKSNSSNLNRDQLFDQAEKLAEMFADFMGDD